MYQKSHMLALLAIVMAGLVCVLAACSSSEDGGFLPGGEPQVSDSSYEREPPKVETCAFGDGNVVNYDDGTQNAVIDMTNVNKGYVGVRANAPQSGMFQVMNNTTGANYIYVMKTDGKDQFYPMSFGDGNYTFTVFIYQGDNPDGTPSNSYFNILGGSVDVQLESEFAPFLVPSVVVSYGKKSDVVTLSHEITQHASTDLEVIQQIYFWVQDNISYDTEKAKKVQTGELTNYVPNLKKILESRSGICYDYASLVAAMLRANGIPCKMVFGDVKTDDSGTTIMHAWNMIWTEEDGWIAVDIKAEVDKWEQVDLTFAAANGSQVAEFIGDGSNYAPMTTH